MKKKHRPTKNAFYIYEGSRQFVENNFSNDGSRHEGKRNVELKANAKHIAA